MTDIFREVDEDLRRDRAAESWQKHGGKLLAVALVIVLATAGWRFYEYRQRLASEAAATRYDQALRLIRDGKHAEGEALLAEASRADHAGYAGLARFRQAAEIGRRDAAAGATAYDALAADAALDATWRELATIRAAVLRFDSAEPDALRRTLTPLAEAGKPWRHPAREMLGLIALRAGDYDAAGRFFDQLVIDGETPQSLRARVQLYLAIVAGGPIPAASAASPEPATPSPALPQTAPTLPLPGAPAAPSGLLPTLPLPGTPAAPASPTVPTPAPQ